MDKKMAAILETVPQMPKRMDSVCAQMEDLVEFAKRFGMEEVVEGLEYKIDFNKKWYGPKPLHPEQRKGEIHLVDTPNQDIKYIGWKTKRMGEKAYDDEGNEVPNMFPIFIMAYEYEERGLLTERFTVKE